MLSEAHSGTRVRVIVSISGHPPVVSDTATLTVGADVTNNIYSVEPSAARRFFGVRVP